MIRLIDSREMRWGICQLMPLIHRPLLSQDGRTRSWAATREMAGTERDGAQRLASQHAAHHTMTGSEAGSLAARQPSDMQGTRGQRWRGMIKSSSRYLQGTIWARLGSNMRAAKVHRARKRRE